MNFKESETLELKKSTSELKEAVISLVAILNKYKKGVLYFGIKDKGVKATPPKLPPKLTPKLLQWNKRS